MKKTLVILRGIPGSGKSTAAEILADTGIAEDFGDPTFKYPVCTADDFFMKSGTYKFDISKLGMAHAECQSKVEMFMTDDTEKIFVANTNTTDKELASYYKLAKDYDYTVFSLIVENRHGGTNTHNVPDATIEKMKNRFSIKL